LAFEHAAAEVVEAPTAPANAAMRTVFQRAGWLLAGSLTESGCEWVMYRITRRNGRPGDASAASRPGPQGDKLNLSQADPPIIAPTRPRRGRSGRVAWDQSAHDLPRLAQFWTQALGWKVLSEREREIVIGTDENAPVGMCFMPVTDPKTVKNRVHLDLTTSGEDRDQEIERLLALGARRADVGQTGAESWTVLADPEGNEFCVVRPKETLIR
jgi:predicted enzyme related to lactoylglutathione lyase